MVKIFHPHGLKELVWKAGRSTEKATFKRMLKKYPGSLKKYPARSEGQSRNLVYFGPPRPPRSGLPADTQCISTKSMPGIGKHNASGEIWVCRNPLDVLDPFSKQR